MTVSSLQELIVADTHPFDYPPPFTSVLLTECRPSWESWKQSIYQIILAIGLYLAPMILMILTYTHIALVLWMQEIPGDSIQGKWRGLRGWGGERFKYLPDCQVPGSHDIDNPHQHSDCSCAVNARDTR